MDAAGQSGSQDATFDFTLPVGHVGDRYLSVELGKTHGQLALSGWKYEHGDAVIDPLALGTFLQRQLLDGVVILGPRIGGTILFHLRLPPVTIVHEPGCS